nr:hypothetical protein [Spirochaeta sp.]
PVSSSRAVERFDNHVPVATETERAFLHANNELVDRIINAPEWRDLCSAVTEATRHGVTIGEQIGVTAALPFVASHTDDGWVAKASGAGNERSVFLVKADHRRPLPEGVRELALTTKGLRCDYLNL